MPRHRHDRIEIKNDKHLAQMRAAGRVVAEVLDLMAAHVRPGITTGELDRIAEEYIRSNGGTPSFKGYPKYLPKDKRFPATLCVAVNDVVVHGIPNGTPLEDGDIIAIDVGVNLDGWHGDATRTYAVGAIDAESQRLMDVCHEALERGIHTARAGRRLTDISAAIEEHVVANGFQVVRNLFAHGIGRNLHEAPSLPHYGPPGEGPVLQPGMVITIEPMIVDGSNDVNLLDDGWTIVTADGSRSAQYEHTVAITDNGPRVLTLR
jgi:methionyl aminopeptidase